MSDHRWWQVKIKTDLDRLAVTLDEIGYQLFDLGAEGTEIQEEQILAYFNGEKFSQQQILQILQKNNFTNYEVLPQGDENWVAKCAELFIPVQIDRLAIEPVFDYQVKPIQADKIYIIPGMGFGSGHHETSQMLIEMAQKVQGLAKQSVLDFGCGSGILSLALAKLYPNLQIFAIDNDPQAILNATDNLQINQMDSQIELSDTPIEAITGKSFDLILANIYLEVLKKYERDIFRLLHPKGTLLLSGLTQDQDQELREAFKNWKLLDQRSKGNWLAYRFQKN